MAWARIHDSALSSPKVVGMFNPREPFHLWIWGLSYAQTHLTDGAIPGEALPHGSGKAAAVLMTKGLWEGDGQGYQIHDYLQWNDSKDVITKKRSAARDRMSRSREQSSRTSRAPLESTSREVLRGVASVSVIPGSDLERGPGGKPLRGGGAMAGSLPRDHRTHAHCGRKCVPEFLHGEFVQGLGGDNADARARAWYVLIESGLGDAPIGDDPLKFWRAQFAASFPSGAPRRSAEQAPTFIEWTCHHAEPKCLARMPCSIRETIESGRAEKAAIRA